MRKHFLSLFFAIFFSLTAESKTLSKKAKQPCNSPTQASIVYDLKSKKVLHAHNSNKPIYPASTTKMMTAYLAFEAIEQGKLKLNDKIKVSPYAASARPCKLGLKSGEIITVEEALKAILIKSANDAARAVSEKIGGSESKFASTMNHKANQLGMKNTHFRNASGWHDPLQKTTAEDLAKLAIALKRDFPKYYPWLAENSFSFKGKIYNGHNRVNQNYPYADGGKTGYVAASGFNLVTTATCNGRQLVGVVIGGRTAKERDNKMIALLDHHFGNKKPLASNSSNKMISLSKTPSFKKSKIKSASTRKRA